MLPKVVIVTVISGISSITKAIIKATSKKRQRKAEEGEEN
jgi:hypothetical protein